MAGAVTGQGTADDPWILQTPPGTSQYRMHRDDEADPPELVCTVGSTKLRYLARCLDDVPAMLRQHNDWMELGSADEGKAAKDGTLEAWGSRRLQPGWRMVRHPQGLSGALRHVCAAAARTPRHRRTRTQPPQQPHPRPVTRSTDP